MGIFKDQEKVRAPELKGGKGWLNTDKPLSIAGLKGKVVLLDFWTYGCINCIHIIPDLKFLEAKYSKNLVVIGVHSAKFKNEAENKNIRKIIMRYGIEHPVVNDADFKIWDAYAVRAWPTQVLIDPAGYVVGRVSGEGHLDTLDRVIGEKVEEFRKKDQLDETPLKFALERAKVGDLPLAFPGKVLADPESNRLFIADSNHNRIVITDLDGKLIDVVGSGDASPKDGDFLNAGFNKPQGMAVDGDILYVADTENHRIRRVDLKSKTVETIAGTGVLRDFNGFGDSGLETALRSPWDVEKVGKYLFVAMAGSHQIWRMDLDRGYIAPYAGTRGESRRDGKIKISEFAQPSGIVSDGKRIFVADSESNIIRDIDLEKEHVSTLVGGDLFAFGDKDGTGDDVRLQHPLGIDLYQGKVLIADTYNHKVKILDVEKRKVKTLIGTGDEGQKDGRNASFYEPGGISVAGDRLYVADTNNHAVRIVDLKTRQTATLKIQGLKPPAEKVSRVVSPNLKVFNLGRKKIPIGSKSSLTFDVELPNGFHLNPNAPQKYEVTFRGGKGIEIERPKERFEDLPLRVEFRTREATTSKISAKLTIYYCREDNTGVCYIKTLIWNVPIDVVSGATADIHLTASVK
ncbi:MAG: redoxin domain-containing protein [Pyrinomonadaceae bacterium]|nr:redoxin domain-containing protein [Pyrinomonadaceae bacterium]